jgi:hypothetical protein
VLLEAYKTSGIVKKQWCKVNAIGLSTLDRWLKQEKKQTQLQPKQNWIPLRAITPKPSGEIEIQLGKCKIVVNNTTDKKLLAAVLGVMVEIC